MSKAIPIRRAEPIRIAAPLSSGPRDPHARVLSAIIALAGPSARVENTRSRAWASATFIGAQHFLDLTMDDRASHELASRLPDENIPIPGHIVADAVIEARAPCADGVRVTVAVLTIEEW